MVNKHTCSVLQSQWDRESFYVYPPRSSQAAAEFFFWNPVQRRGHYYPNAEDIELSERLGREMQDLIGLIKVQVATTAETTATQVRRDNAILLMRNVINILGFLAGVGA